MKYNDLDEHEKALFDRIDNLYITYVSVKRDEYVKVLAMLINKYKIKKPR